MSTEAPIGDSSRAEGPSEDGPNGDGLCEPLLFERIYLEKVWGGRELERALGIELPAEVEVGETWELCDRGDNNSVVASGACAGRELRGLMMSSAGSLLGRARPSTTGAFPLLIKYLDAKKPLSVQVHPDHKTARRLGVESGKTECWYILSAEPGALIYLGLKPDVDATTFAEKAAGPEVVDLLMPYEVEAGQFVFVPAGTVHAIGAGVTLAEVQENSDVTFRLYDWGRLGLDGNPRAAHVEEALLAMQYDQLLEGPVTPDLDGELNRFAQLADCEAFGVELHDVAGRIEFDTEGVPNAYIVVAGKGLIRIGAEERAIKTGDVWLAPACVGAHALELDAEELRVLRVTARE
jgi:mannose-6-phosphate isomerase